MPHPAVNHVGIDGEPRSAISTSRLIAAEEVGLAVVLTVIVDNEMIAAVEVTVVEQTVPTLSVDVERLVVYDMRVVGVTVVSWVTVPGTE